MAKEEDFSKKERKLIELIRQILKFPGTSRGETPKEWRQRSKRKQKDWGQIAKED